MPTKTGRSLSLRMRTVPRKSSVAQSGPSRLTSALSETIAYVDVSKSPRRRHEEAVVVALDTVDDDDRAAADEQQERQQRRDAAEHEQHGAAASPRIR